MASIRRGRGENADLDQPVECLFRHPVAGIHHFGAGPGLLAGECAFEDPVLDLERFRRTGSKAEPVVIGARRKPEAVVLSYERYLELAGGRERVRAALERQAETMGRELNEEEAMELANEALQEVRRNRHTGSQRE